VTCPESPLAAGTVAAFTCSVTGLWVPPVAADFGAGAFVLAASMSGFCAAAARVLGSV